MSARRPDAGVVTAVLLVLAAGATVALTSPAESTTPRGPATSAVPVVRTALACPDLTPPAGRSASVRVGLAPAATGLRGGTVRTGPVGGPARPSALARGAFQALPAGAEAAAVRADGPAAAGLFAARDDTTGHRALGVTGCPAPRARWWFTGAGAGLDHDSTLVLTNLDPGPAVVDLTVLGPDGPVDTVAGSGVLVPAGTSRRVALSDLAPRTDELALVVRAERGRVVATVDDTLRGSATARRGQEWLPGTRAPARTLVLAGAPAQAARRTLLVANPTDREAVVEVRLSGRGGAFTPTGFDPVSVAPGTLRAVDLTGVLARAGDQPAVLLRSSQPVTASLRSRVGSDLSYATAVDALTGPAAAPVPGGLRVGVTLTAAARATGVRLTAYDARGGQRGGTTLHLGPSATGAWTPPAGTAYVLVRPSRAGSVSGAVAYTGPGVATLPLTPLPLRELRPAVRPGPP